MKGLPQTGAVESRIFSGQHGRGGDVTKVRVAYDKEDQSVKKIVSEIVEGRSRVLA